MRGLRVIEPLEDGMHKEGLTEDIVVVSDVAIFGRVERKHTMVSELRGMQIDRHRRKIRRLLALLGSYNAQQIQTNKKKTNKCRSKGLL